MTCPMVHILHHFWSPLTTTSTICQIQCESMQKSHWTCPAPVNQLLPNVTRISVTDGDVRAKPICQFSCPPPPLLLRELILC
ncbi:hypothetical protein GDO81_003540 [Engystomops pustulosus]|uniref:Uncharacterized protein n=1 Tax=Engystomops pustulosus TaxID=76066 RepID=A0AAV6ZWP4_ENGPU|nr:hypothetical protein GDO81_003540 [Engystomops pustulosus]